VPVIVAIALLLIVAGVVIAELPERTHRLPICSSKCHPVLDPSESPNPNVVSLAWPAQRSAVQALNLTPGVAGAHGPLIRHPSLADQQ
jgi:hypothetical protein